jgi:hypothetical protein
MVGGQAREAVEDNGLCVLPALGWGRTLLIDQVSKDIILSPRI